MIRGLGAFERFQTLGAPKFSYGNMNVPCGISLNSSKEAKHFDSFKNRFLRRAVANGVVFNVCQFLCVTILQKSVLVSDNKNVSKEDGRCSKCCTSTI